MSRAARLLPFVAALAGWTALGIGALVLFWLNLRAVPCAGLALGTWAVPARASACQALIDEANVRMLIEQLLLVGAIAIGYCAIVAMWIRRRRDGGGR